MPEIGATNGCFYAYSQFILPLWFLSFKKIVLSALHFVNRSFCVLHRRTVGVHEHVELPPIKPDLISLPSVIIFSPGRQTKAIQGKPGSRSARLGRERKGFVWERLLRARRFVTIPP